MADPKQDMLDAVDTVMRCAHNLRRVRDRRLTPAECTILAADDRLQRSGWTWTGDGDPQHSALSVEGKKNG